MIEGGVDHSIRLARAFAQAFEIIERAAMDLSAGRFQRASSGVGAGEAEHLMARGNKLEDDGRADEAGGTSNENAHEKISSVVLKRDMAQAPVMLK